MSAAETASNIESHRCQVGPKVRRRVPRQMSLQLVTARSAATTSAPPQAISEMTKTSVMHAVNAGSSLSDTWSAIEDVLLRLSEHVTWHAMQTTDDHSMELTATEFETIEDESMRDVCGAATQPELYKCRATGQVQVIVQHIEHRGDDLVLVFAPMRVIRLWEEGDEVAPRIQAFMTRTAEQAKQRSP